MENLREIVKDCLKAKNEELDKNLMVKSAKVFGAKYFVIQNNGEVKGSEYDYVLDNSEIELVFVFPKVSYTPMLNYYTSYLSPIIINSKFEISEESLIINDWTFKFEGQFLSNVYGPINIYITNEKLGFFDNAKTIHLDVDIDGFAKLYKLIDVLSSCTTKSEAIYLSDIYKKDAEIEMLKNKVSSSAADLHVKKLAIEGYKDLLKSISDIVNSKKE